MRLSRDKIQRMINAGGGSSSGGGGGSDIAGGVTQAWVNQNYVSIEFFRKVFKVWAAGETSSDPDVEIMPNDITTTVKNIQAQAGLWTEAFLSALGQGSGGGTGGATTLDQLDDVVITSPTNGQALIYNATTQMWVNGTIQSGTDMATVWSALAAATNEQINASHLSGVLADYVTTASLQTILGDYLTQTAADQRYITIAYFDRLFRAYNGSTLVSHNDTTTTIDNIKAMFGFWTDMYLSALGRNSAATGLGLDNLTDVTINTPTDGQVLQYNATSAKWENAMLQTVVALSGLTDVLLTTPQSNQVLIYDSSSSKWINSSLKTVNGYSLIGTGDIPASGGASGNYVAKAGDTMSGLLKIAYGSTSGGLFGSQGLWISRTTINSGDINLGATMAITCYNNNGLVLSGSYYTGTIAFYDGSFKPVITITRGLNVGIGTTNPSYKLDVSGGARITGTMWCSDYRATSGEGLLTIYPSDWGGVGSNEWAVGSSAVNGVIRGAYNLYFSDKTDTRYNIITGKGGTMVGRLILDFDNDAYAGSADSGSMRIGTASGNHLLFDGNEIVAASGTSPGTLFLQYDGGTIECGGNGSCSFNVRGSLYATGAITALSDARKKDITGEAGVTVEQIAQAPAVQFLWKDKERRKDGQQVGTLAQYWQTVLPEVVMDKGGELSMQYGVAALVSAITIARKVVDHERRIKQLEQENEELKKQLNAA